MAFSRVKISAIGSIILGAAWLMGCGKSAEELNAKAKVAINYFLMEMNGQVWTPYQDPGDPCTSTFSGISGGIGEKPLYTFSAYRDPTGRTDAYSENLLRMQLLNVTEPALYLLEGTYKKDFDSYFIFQMRQPAGEVKRYTNIPQRYPFVVNVEAITTKKAYTIPGIKGTFAGVVYNEDNPLDSLVIEKGKFSFDVLSAQYDYHCGM